MNPLLFSHILDRSCFLDFGTEYRLLLSCNAEEINHECQCNPWRKRKEERTRIREKSVMPLTLSKFCYLEDKSETLKDLSGEESRRWKDCCTTSDLRSWNTWFIIQDRLQNTISCDGKETAKREEQREKTPFFSTRLLLNSSSCSSAFSFMPRLLPLSMPLLCYCFIGSKWERVRQEERLSVKAEDTEDREEWSFPDKRWKVRD